MTAGLRRVVAKTRSNSERSKAKLADRLARLFRLRFPQVGDDLLRRGPLDAVEHRLMLARRMRRKGCLPVTERQQAFGRGPGQAPGLGDDQDRIGAILHHSALDNIERQAAQRGDGGGGFLELAGLGKCRDIRLAQLPVACMDSTRAQASA